MFLKGITSRGRGNVGAEAIRLQVSLAAGVGDLGPELHRITKYTMLDVSGRQMGASESPYGPAPMIATAILFTSNPSGHDARRRLQEAANGSEAKIYLGKRVDYAWHGIASLSGYIDRVRRIPLHPRPPVGEVFMRYPRGHVEREEHRTESKTIIKDRARCVVIMLGF